MNRSLLIIMLLGFAKAALADGYSSQILADSPIGYWRLGEAPAAAIALDSSNSSFNGTYNSSVTTGAPGALVYPNTAAIFVGDGFNGGFVDVGYQSALDLTSDFTVEAWLKTTAIGGTQRIVSNRFYGGAFGQGFGLGIEDSHLIFSAFGVEDYRTQDAILADAWYHLAIVVDSQGGPTFYLNGELFQSFASAGPIVASPSSLQIGRNPMADGSFSFEPFNGVLDELAIYDATLDANRIRQHFQAAVPEPASWVLLGIGFSALVAIVRHRRQALGVGRRRPAKAGAPGQN